MDAEMMRFVREEIKKQVHIIFTGTAQSAATHTETINDYLPGAPSVTDRPIMHPFGYMSKAPDGTLSVVARQGDHPANMVVLGHRDKGKPTDIDAGESVVYSLGGFKIKFFNDKVQVAKGSDYETIVCGETLIEFLKSFIKHIMEHQHLGNLGFQTSVPLNNPDFESDQANFLDNEKILAKTGGRY